MCQYAPHSVAQNVFMVLSEHKYNYLPLSLQVYNRENAALGRAEIDYEKGKT